EQLVHKRISFTYKSELEAYADLNTDTFLIEHIILHNDFSIDMAVYIPVENKYHYHIAVQTDVQELAKLLRNTVFGEDELYAVNKLYNSIKSPKKNGCF